MLLFLLALVHHLTTDRRPLVILAVDVSIGVCGAFQSICFYGSLANCGGTLDDYAGFGDGYGFTPHAAATAFVINGKADLVSSFSIISVGWVGLVGGVAVSKIPNTCHDLGSVRNLELVLEHQFGFATEILRHLSQNFKATLGFGFGGNTDAPGNHLSVGE